MSAAPRGRGGQRGAVRAAAQRVDVPAGLAQHGGGGLEVAAFVRVSVLAVSNPAGMVIAAMVATASTGTAMRATRMAPGHLRASAAISASPVANGASDMIVIAVGSTRTGAPFCM
jgi:hypothetical protein